MAQRLLFFANPSHLPPTHTLSLATPISPSSARSGRMQWEGGLAKVKNSYTGRPESGLQSRAPASAQLPLSVPRWASDTGTMALFCPQHRAKAQGPGPQPHTSRAGLLLLTLGPRLPRGKEQQPRWLSSHHAPSGGVLSPRGQRGER